MLQRGSSSWDATSVRASKARRCYAKPRTTLRRVDFRFSEATVGVRVAHSRLNFVVTKELLCLSR